MKNVLTSTLIFVAFLSVGQTNTFPIFSSGGYTGGSGDFTNISSAQLKLQSTNGYIRVPHLSYNSAISVVYNYENGKLVYWGEPSDAGQYLFRGRDFVVEEGKMGIGTTSPSYKAVISNNGAAGLEIDPTGVQFQQGVGIQAYNRTTGTFLPLQVYGSELVLGGGNVGINTTSPTAKLEVNQSGGGSGQNVALKTWAGNTDNYWGNTQIQFSYGGGSGGYTHAIKSRHNSGGILGNAIDFYLWQPGDPVNGEGSLSTLTLNGGNVGIGTASPDAKLSVKGQIHAQEVKVDLNGSVAPDYVFNKDYQLTSLDSIKNYIDQNKHLPEVPSAKEMEKNGVQLGEMNMLLLKKIEELTLYVIDQQKQIEQLRQTINSKK